jgi:hypothetical protein
MTNEEILKLIESKKFKRNHIPETEKVIFSISGKTIGCSQSFVCFQGMPKNGKSLFITSAIASAFTTWDIFEMKINFQNNRKRLCYVDTESSDFDFLKIAQLRAEAKEKFSKQSRKLNTKKVLYQKV